MNLRKIFILLCLLSIVNLNAQVGPDHSKKMKEGLSLFKNKVKGLFIDPAYNSIA